eukprot:CAMPEP_0178419606 /NCGR_PEP_ID=MMETSP0689_2-20121128/25698_1 /TAXON_ID=160604 /ORGANISM="Amphidinium massartii, Strain CS-259" /LENGTH=58 /DNA_ID=CAMNT_0020041051 /DNA_START=212 /DNA_END=388 /DNA_ORIENTATION=+
MYTLNSSSPTETSRLKGVELPLDNVRDERLPQDVDKVNVIDDGAALGQHDEDCVESAG